MVQDEQVETSFGWAHARQFLRLPMNVLVMFAAATIGIWGGARVVMVDRVNLVALLSTFSDVFPGASRDSVLVRRFSCNGNYVSTGYEYCSLSLSEGVFSRMGVVIVEGIVVRIDFTMRGRAIRMGDLMMLWGRPSVKMDRTTMHFYWAESGTTANARTVSGTALYSPYMVAYDLSFTAAGKVPLVDVPGSPKWQINE
ncbi:MAG: hypothetical protein R3E39_18535 [Anaerolineae bacterium]